MWDTKHQVCSQQKDGKKGTSNLSQEVDAPLRVSWKLESTLQMWNRQVTTKGMHAKESKESGTLKFTAVREDGKVQETHPFTHLGVP